LKLLERDGGERIKKPKSSHWGEPGCSQKGAQIWAKINRRGDKNHGEIKDTRGIEEKSPGTKTQQ